MIIYFPSIYPDELIYSWFCRYYVQSGSMTSKMALQELYCKRSDNPNKEFIGNLNSKAKELISRLYPFEKLILEHTMYPQYARFLPLSHRQNTFNQLLQGDCNSHYLFSSQPRQYQYLRYCPICVIEDRNLYGETYWHRKHQIRNMEICTKHQCKLINSNVLIKSEQSYTFCPAENYVPSTIATLENSSSILQYSLFLETIFNSSFDFQNYAPIHFILQEKIKHTKYVSSNGNMKYLKKLKDDMDIFFSPTNTPSINHIHRIFVGQRFDFQSVCQLVFFLEINSKDFMLLS